VIATGSLCKIANYI